MTCARCGAPIKRVHPRSGPVFLAHVVEDLDADHDAVSDA